MTKNTEIHNLSIEEIEAVLRNVGYEDEIIIEGKLDTAHVIKVKGLDAAYHVTLMLSTWLTSELALESDSISEQYYIPAIAKKLYELENSNN